MTKKIYRLVTDCNNDVVIRTHLEYFRDNFVGLTMSQEWVPPEVRIVGKTKRNRDFLSWMLSAPVISGKGRAALEPLIGAYAEFLPLIVLNGTQYFAINVTCLIDCLDFEKSDVIYAPYDNSHIMSVNRYTFIDSKVRDTPIFKIKEWPFDVLVTESFVNQVQRFDLKGAEFVDPGTDPFEAL